MHSIVSHLLMGKARGLIISDELLAERSESPVDVFSGLHRCYRHSISDRYAVIQAVLP